MENIINYLHSKKITFVKNYSIRGIPGTFDFYIPPKTLIKLVPKENKLNYGLADAIAKINLFHQVTESIQQRMKVILMCGKCTELPLALNMNCDVYMCTSYNGTQLKDWIIYKTNQEVDVFCKSREKELLW